MRKLFSFKHKRRVVVPVFMIIAIFLFFNTFMNTAINPFWSSHMGHHSPGTTVEKMFHNNVGKVRVFMYDLPKRFTTGIIERQALARGSSNVLKAKYPGHQHMGEWYMFMDLLRPVKERVGSPVVKVDDPGEAELFYVPVFSSLSLIVNPVGGTGSGGAHEYSDEDMQMALVEWLEQQEHWKKNNGRDHVIMAGDPNALHMVLDRVKNAVLLLSDFGRVRVDQGSLVKDVIVPYAHRINTYQGNIGVENRKTLLFFMGNKFRKDGGKIRGLLFEILEKEDDIIIKHGTQSRENRRLASQGMHTSKFCLNPAGDTPSACRLFDSIVSLCVPVIVSDSIELPFEDIIDYSRIAIFVTMVDSLNPGYLVKILRSVTAQRILEYQKEMRKVWYLIELLCV